MSSPARDVHHQTHACFTSLSPLLVFRADPLLILTTPDLYCSPPLASCNPVAIDDIEVRTGGWPVRIIADDKFTVFADGKEVGSGQWAKRENSIDVNRFRISKETKVIGLLVEGTPKARGERDEHLKTGMTAVLGSIGGSLVTSATWSCTDKVGDAKWLKQASTEAFKKQADTWASAAELGDNQEPGIDPWGIIPGIAKSARWIFSHSTTKNANTKTYCRVDTRNAWHSYDMAHPSASRWSCANREHRMSAGVISLTSDNSRISFPTKEVATQNHRTTYKESTNGWAPLRADDKQTLQMVLRVNLGDIFDKTTEGAMIKVGYLRLFTAEAGVDGEICNLGANKKDAKALTEKWSQDDCTFERVEKNPKQECKKFKSVKNDFIRVDISDWVRGWRTDKTTNIGMLIGIKSGTLRIAATDYSAAAADLRPRLSLSCHGDQANPDAVFKERRAEMVVPDADAPADNVFIGSRLPKNFKATGWFSDKKALAEADREFSSSQ